MPDLGNDGICVIKVNIDQNDVYIIGVYLPYEGCKIANFTDQIYQIEQILMNQLNGKNAILIGDWNCHFGVDYIQSRLIRAWGRSYRNSHLMMDTLTRCGMSIVDIGSKGKGSLYTFSGHRSDKVYQSYIDHCVISDEILSYVECCEILCDDVDNVSDHLAINLKIGLKSGYQVHGRNNHRCKVGWYKVTVDEITQLYTIPLDANIVNWMNENVNAEIENESHIERLTDEMTNLFIKASEHIPQVKFNKSLKPYWNDTLTKLSKTNKKISFIQNE